MERTAPQPSFAELLGVRSSAPKAVPVPEQLLTADDLAARWQVRRQEVHALAQEGELTCVRLGKYVRFRLASVEAWERKRESAYATPVQRFQLVADEPEVEPLPRTARVVSED